MIRVTFAFPYQDGKKFDWDYFSNNHLPLLHEHLDSRGMTNLAIDKGISGTDPSSNPPFTAVMHMTFATVDEVHQAFMAVGRPVMGDLGNYTDIKPTVQISEIVG